MAWNPNIPQPTDTLSQSQQDILGNFQALDALFDDGIQDYVILPVQTSDPATSSTQIAIYSKVDSTTTTQELFLRRVSSGAVIDMTASLKATNGWTYLPSGLLVKWGTATITGLNSLKTVTFPAAGTIPAFNNIFSMQVSTGVSSATDYNQTTMISSFSTTQFIVYVRQLIGIPPTSCTIYYFAIGN